MFFSLFFINRWPRTRVTWIWVEIQTDLLLVATRLLVKDYISNMPKPCETEKNILCMDYYRHHYHQFELSVNFKFTLYCKYSSPVTQRTTKNFKICNWLFNIFVWIPLCRFEFWLLFLYNYHKWCQVISDETLHLCWKMRRWLSPTQSECKIGLHNTWKPIWNMLCCVGG